jgi:hypothetical protein
VAHIGEMTNAYKILVGKSKRRYHVEDLGVNEKIMLPCVKKRQEYGFVD